MKLKCFTLIWKCFSDQIFNRQINTKEFPKINIPPPHTHTQKAQFLRTPSSNFQNSSSIAKSDWSALYNKTLHFGKLSLLGNPDTLPTLWLVSWQKLKGLRHRLGLGSLIKRPTTSAMVESLCVLGLQIKTFQNVFSYARRVIKYKLWRISGSATYLGNQCGCILMLLQFLTVNLQHILAFFNMQKNLAKQKSYLLKVLNITV